VPVAGRGWLSNSRNSLSRRVVVLTLCSTPPHSSSFQPSARVVLLPPPPKPAALTLLRSPTEHHVVPLLGTGRIAVACYTSNLGWNRAEETVS